MKIFANNIKETIPIQNTLFIQPHRIAPRQQKLQNPKETSLVISNTLVKKTKKVNYKLCNSVANDKACKSKTESGSHRHSAPQDGRLATVSMDFLLRRRRRL